MTKKVFVTLKISIVFSFQALPKFLLCVNWADLDQVLEVHRLLKVWHPLTLPVSYYYSGCVAVTAHMIHWLTGGNGVTRLSLC